MTDAPGDGTPQPHDPPPQQPPHPSQGYPPPGDQQPPTAAGWYGGPTANRLPDHPEATKALVLGIVALLGGLTCFLPLLLGPWAWVVGRKAVREIDAQPGRYEGRSQALAGYVTGVIATVVLVIGVLAVIGLLVVVISVGISGPPQPTPGQSF